MLVWVGLEGMDVCGGVVKGYGRVCGCRMYLLGWTR